MYNMSQELLGILLAIVSVASYAVASILMKVGAVTQTPQKLMFTRNVVTATIILVVALVKGDTAFFGNFSMMAYVFVIALFLYIGVLAIIRSYSLGKLGIASSIAEARFIPSMIVYALVFGEVIRLQQYVAAGIMLVVITILLLRARTHGKATNEQISIKLAVFNAFVFGVGFALYYYPTMIVGALAVGFLSEFSLMVYAALHLLVTKELFRPDIPPGVIKNIPVAVAAALGTIFFYTALSIGNPSTVAITMASAPVLSIIGGGVVFKEKYSTWEWIAVALVLCALFVLSL